MQNTPVMYRATFDLNDLTSAPMTLMLVRAEESPSGVDATERVCAPGHCPTCGGPVEDQDAAYHFGKGEFHQTICSLDCLYLAIGDAMAESGWSRFIPEAREVYEHLQWKMAVMSDEPGDLLEAI